MNNLKSWCYIFHCSVEAPAELNVGTYNVYQYYLFPGYFRTERSTVEEKQTGKIH